MARAKYKWLLTYTSIEGEKISEIIFVEWALHARITGILKTCDKLTITRTTLQ